MRWPICDEIEFRFSRTVAIRGDILADAFDPVSEELTFLELESHAAFHENVARALKQVKQSRKDAQPTKERHR